MTGHDPIPAYVPTPAGRMHVVVADPGAGPWLVLLHQTPRSWDEFAAVVPHLKDYRVVIPDLPGHGKSPALPDNTIEAAAGAVAAVLDEVGAAHAHVVGHHFGGLVAYHLAASAPERVQSLVLSSTPFIDAAERERRKDAPPFNAVAPRSDGGHLAQLWQRRCDYLARLDPAVLGRYIRDVLAHPDPDRGHEAVAVYRSEAGLGRYRGPVLCLASARDPRAFGRRHAILGAFPGAREHVLETGDIASPETCPAEFSRAIVDFHAELAVL